MVSSVPVVVCSVIVVVLELYFMMSLFQYWMCGVVVSRVGSCGSWCHC